MRSFRVALGGRQTACSCLVGLLWLCLLPPILASGSESGSSFVEFVETTAAHPTCASACEAAGVGLVTMEPFDRPNAFMCGRAMPLIGHLLLGEGTSSSTTGADGACRIFNGHTQLEEDYLPGDFLCACDKFYGGSVNFRWRSMGGCPEDQRMELAVGCAARATGMAQYSVGYLSNVGGTTRCLTPDGLSTIGIMFYVYCDYP